MKAGSLKRLIKTVCLLVLGIMVISMFGCGTKNVYNVDYDGEKEFWDGAKDSYREGSKVRIYYTLQIMDADLSFFIDGEPVSAYWEEWKGYKLEFVMPAHDVKITTTVTDSMTYIEP